MARAHEATVKIVVYTPTPHERAAALCEAVFRYEDHEGKRKRDGNGSNLPGGDKHQLRAERISTHYDAALAEIAVSRMTNLAWTGCSPWAPDVIDVGECIEVRNVSQPGHCLIVRLKDKAHKWCPFVLTYVTPGGDVEFLGWEYGEEVIDHGTWRAGDGKGYWEMRQEQLQDFDQLRASVMRMRGVPT